MTTTNEIISEFRRTLPVAFKRKDVPALIGGIIKAQTLANLQCQQQGPPAAKCNGRVVFFRDSFCDWLEGRMR